MAPATLPLAPQRWPFLVQMARNYSQQLKCITEIVKYYNWQRVIAVHEDDGYAGTCLMLDLLSQSLQAVGAVIEYRLALPPLDVVSNPKEVVLAELVKVFQKGSPITADVSKAILRLSESGVLKALEDKWFSPSLECAASSTDNNVESLSIQGFWVLYLFSGASSTICFLLFLIRLLKDYAKETMIPRNVNTFREQLAGLWRYYDRGQIGTTHASNTLNLTEWTPQWGYASPAGSSEHYSKPPSHYSTPPSLIKMSDSSRQQHQIS
ncbi:hypothetical protein Ancab_033920 [Ancistrocladus abbreviatus]